MVDAARVLYQAFEIISKGNQTTGITDIANENEFYSYQDVYNKAEKMALPLCTSLQNGSRAGLLIENSIERVVLVLALLKRGIVIVPINPLSTKDVIEHITKEANLQVVFVSQKYEDIWSEQQPMSVTVVSVEECFNAKANKSFPVEDIPSSAAALIVYTSGSTGKPKGVIISHANLSSHVLLYREAYNLNASNDIMCLYSQISYMSYWVEFFNALLNGISCILVNENIVKDFPLFSSALEKFKVTFFVGAFTILGELSKHTPCNRYLKTVAAGSETMSLKQMKDFYKSFPHSKVYNDYGSTETTYTISVPQEDIFSYKCQSIIGQGMNNAKMYIVDANGELVDDKTEGELWVSGPTIANGYVNENLAKQYFIKDPFDEHSSYKVFKTGDFVRMTGEGIEYVGRRDNIIKIRGHKVNILEVEKIINEFFPEVQAFVSTKVNPATSLVQLYAFYTPTEISISEIRKQVASSLPSYMVPKFYRVDGFPRTTSGKIDRRMLSKYCTDENQLKHLLDTGSSLDKIKYATCKVLDITVDDFDASQSFVQHGGDSINIFLFLSELNSLGLTTTYQEILNQRALYSLFDDAQDDCICTGAVSADNYQSIDGDNGSISCAIELVSFSMLSNEELISVANGLDKEFADKLLLMSIHDEKGEMDGVFLDVVIKAREVFPHLCVAAKIRDKIAGAFVLFPAGQVPAAEKFPVSLATFLESSEIDVIEQLHEEGHVVADAFMVYANGEMNTKESLQILEVLMKKENEVAKENGFTAVLSLNVSPATQGIAKYTFHSVVKKRVYPCNFEMNGTFPYKEFQPNYFIEVAVDYL